MSTPNPCPKTFRCVDSDCDKWHPHERPTTCPEQSSCTTYDCPLTHPRSRPSRCPLAGVCGRGGTCFLLHPEIVIDQVGGSIMGGAYEEDDDDGMDEATRR